MELKRKYVAVAAAIAALGAGTGVALARAGSDDDAAEQVSGPDAAKAKAAALAVTGGGTANAVERDDEDGAVWEVEVRRPDGQTVDVRLDGDYGKVAVESDSEEADDSD
ncbi:MAG: hypothetical protein R2691_07315 [Solirubrobacterales bacterium]